MTTEQREQHHTLRGAREAIIQTLLGTSLVHIIYFLSTPIVASVCGSTSLQLWSDHSEASLYSILQAIGHMNCSSRVRRLKIHDKPISKCTFVIYAVDRPRHETEILRGSRYRPLLELYRARKSTAKLQPSPFLPEADRQQCPG